MDIKLREILQEDIKLLKPWLIERENAKWLDTFFQNEGLRDEQLAIFLIKKDRRTFMILNNEIPVGIMGITNIDKINESGEIWSLLGNKDFRNKGIITIAYVLTLKKAFYELHLHSINAWVAEGNFTIRVFEKLGFNVIGRQRKCHLMDGILKDRILFDLLRDEFDEDALFKKLEI